MAQIWVIGTSHCDDRGPKRLKKALNKIHPHIILCEGSDSAYRKHLFEIEYKERILRSLWGNTATIDYFMKQERECAYESSVAQEYASEKGAEFYWLEREESFSKANIRNRISRWARSPFFTEPLPNVKKIFEDIREQYRQDFSRYRNLCVADEMAFASCFIQADKHDPKCLRDKQMEKTVRKYASQEPESTIATIVGFGHALQELRGRTFYSKIQDLNPKRIILNY